MRHESHGRGAAAARFSVVAWAVLALTAAVTAQEPAPPPAEKMPANRAELDRVIADAIKAHEDKKKKDDEDKKRHDEEAKKAEGYEVGTSLGMAGTWRNGLVWETANKDFSYHAGAILQYDAAFYTADDLLQTGPGGVGRFSDGANLRRGRLRLEGTMWEVIEYRFELEFFNGVTAANVQANQSLDSRDVFETPGPTDGWVQIRQLPVLGNVRIGSQKEWWSLEHIEDFRALKFLERSYLFDFAQPTAFNNGFSPGVSAFRTYLDGRLWSGIGVYKNESSLYGFGTGDGQYAVTGRLTGLPVYDEDAHTLVHVGGAFSLRDPVDDRVQVRIRNSVRNAPFPLLNLLVNTGLLEVGRQRLYNLEAAAACGPWTVQAEYTANVLEATRRAATSTAPAGPPQGNILFQGCYVEVLYFLTGESRTWNTEIGQWNRVIPTEPFYLVEGRRGTCFGRGAWEVGVRYTYLDASNKGLRFGRLDDLTVGLNWYWNPNARMQFNYDIARRGDVAVPAQGVVQSLGVRMQVDF